MTAPTSKSIFTCFSLYALFHATHSLEPNGDLKHQHQHNPYLLNLTVVPYHYTLRIRPILHDGFAELYQFTAPSEITIRVEAIKNASIITMHQRNLLVDMGDVRVRNIDSGTIFERLIHIFEPDRDLYTIQLKEPFKVGDKLEITIPYTVFISQTEHVGLYLGQYDDPATNKTRYLAATKLEPYHARKVMPLFDEPSLKAMWTIIVGRVDDGKYHSLSNMEIEKVVEDTDHEGWVWDHYYKSVPMSPYLVCVIVSDFANETLYLPESNKRISTWAPKHFIDRGGGLYGTQVAAKILTFFEKKFKMSYPLNKLDAVALPQFPTGATENFGVATYRHKNLVRIVGQNTESERRKITQVLAHEVAHQWYGNLVTCAWWSDIWLNEGFARFLQFWGMQEVIPEFKVEEAFVNDIVQVAMKFDQTSATHPLKNHAQSPLESSAVFNKISYEKGAAILKMLEGFLTKEVFETGITDNYLHKKKWFSAYQDDLFQGLQEAVELHDAQYLLPSDVTIGDIMETWTLHSGYPLIKVKVLDQQTISISQEKFKFNYRHDQDSTSDSKWWVPISIVTGSNENDLATPVSNFWLPKNISNVKYSSPNIDTKKGWTMINPNATSFYRVLYDSTMTEMIRKQLLKDHTVISSSSRSQLLDDYFNFGIAGYIPMQQALELTRYLGNEVESNVWKSVLFHLKNLHVSFRGDEDADEVFKKFFLPRIEQSLELIGPHQEDGEQGINVTLRSKLYDLACQLDSKICWDYAKNLLAEWQQNPAVNPFPLDLRSVLYCPAIASVSSKSSHSSGWNFFMKKYVESDLATEKAALANALTCSKNLTDLENLLEMSIISDSEKDFAEHKMQILEKIATQPVAKSMVYRFVKRAFMEGKVPPGAVKYAVIDLSRTVNQTSLHLDEFQKFIEEYENSSSGKEVTATSTLFKETLKELKASSYKPCKRCGHWWETIGLQVYSWLLEQERTEQL